MLKLLGIVFLSMSLIPTSSFGFGEDLCFTKVGKVENCLKYPDDGEDRSLWTQIQTTLHALRSRLWATPLFGRYLLGARSMVHFDATFYMAQFVGFPYLHAHQIASYDQAIDSPGGIYVPFDQAGKPLVEDIRDCDPESEYRPVKCDYVSKRVEGMHRFNFQTMGGLYHFVTPSNPERASIDGLHPSLLDEREITLRNLEGWIYQDRPLCVGGLASNSGGCNGLSDLILEQMDDPQYLIGEISLSQLGFFPRQIRIELGEQVIGYGGPNRTLPIRSRELHLLVGENEKEQEAVKLGIYLHALKDRVSHHQCGDFSTIGLQIPEFHFKVELDRENCAVMGKHILRHSLEVGMDQMEVPPEDRTVQPALEVSFSELLKYAEVKGFAHQRAKDPVQVQQFLNSLNLALELRDPNERIHRLTREMAAFGLEPLPGHSTSANYISNKESYENE